MNKDQAPKSILFFDTETTDKFPKLARILTIYMMLKGIDGRVIREWKWTLNPGVEVPEEASGVNGLTTEYIQANGRTDLLAAITEIYGVLLTATKKRIPIVAYNLPYDLTVVDREMRRQNLPLGVTKLVSGQPNYFPPAVFFDPLIWSRTEFKFAKGGHKQFAVAKRLGIAVDESRLHDAQYDVELGAQIAWKMFQKHSQGFDSVEAMSATLPKRNEVWARELTAYFARIGKLNEDGSPIDIEAAFPYHRVTEDETEFYQSSRRYK